MRADGGCNRYTPSDEGWGRGRRPVINVSWDDAKAYVGWLSRKTGKTYRLLSEAEREYVTRAGTTTPFWWGTSISTQQANYNGNYTYGTGATGVSRRQTVLVDSFQPNPWGLYQVHGNVWEWTEDCWHDNYSGAPSDGSCPSRWCLVLLSVAPPRGLPPLELRRRPGERRWVPSWEDAYPLSRCVRPVSAVHVTAGQMP